MRRFVLSLGFASLLCGAWLLSPASSSAQASPLGGSPTGTYFVRFSVGKSTLLGLGTLHTDGSWSMNDQTDYGGIPGLQSVQSNWRGVWKITGPRQVTLHGLCFNFGPGGVPTGTARVKAVFNFTPGFASGTGVASQRFYSLTQNPLDPNGGTPAPPPLDKLVANAVKLVR